MIARLQVPSYNGLKGVDVELFPLTVLVGPNGVGKSMLLRYLRSCLEFQPPSPALPPRLLQLNPSAMNSCSPRSLEPRRTFVDAHGEGFHGIYAGLGSGPFEAISADVARLFPQVRRLDRRGQGNLLIIVMQDGTIAEIPSNGLWRYLAYAALPYLAPTPLLLVENPEDGLHPRHVKDVMAIFRRLVAEGTQVVIETHSPQVLDEVTGTEAILMTRDEVGTRMTPLKDTIDFKVRSHCWPLGEMWLSFSDGDRERALVPPRTGPPEAAPTKEDA